MSRPAIIYSSSLASPRRLLGLPSSPRSPPPGLSLKSPILHLSIPRRRTLSFATPAMSSSPRFLVLDDADDPLDFSAVASAAFLPLQQCSRKRERAAALPEVVEVQADGGGRAEEAEVKARPTKKGIRLSLNFLEESFFILSAFANAPIIVPMFHSLPGQHLYYIS
jgi:hypothetical protein